MLNLVAKFEMKFVRTNGDVKEMRETFTQLQESFISESLDRENGTKARSESSMSRMSLKSHSISSEDEGRGLKRQRAKLPKNWVIKTDTCNTVEIIH